MPHWANSGFSASFKLSSSTGNCSRSNGISLARIGTISNSTLSTTIKNKTSTSTTATTRGMRPRPMSSIQLTTGVSA